MSKYIVTFDVISQENTENIVFLSDSIPVDIDMSNSGASDFSQLAKKNANEYINDLSSTYIPDPHHIAITGVYPL
ncbi:hypothetical protein ABLB69_16135 [Xenorhabdus khoisanae]|uniref:hypothetical protein n=1 Tax=Xenorhabdus khoisanae TaxID=880157 RepID=UPI0032B862F0